MAWWIHKPDNAKRQKQGRDKGERTVTAFFYDLWSAGEDKIACSFFGAVCPISACL